jgi:hypothetical protein
MKRFCFLWLVIICAICAGLGTLGGAAEAAPVSSLPDLSPLTPYTAFGNDINLNLATVQGNTGISADGTFKMSAPSFVNGALNLDSGVNRSIAKPSNVSGGINSPVNLAAAQALVLSASSALKSLTPDYSLGNVTTAQTFAATSPVTVIDMSGLTLGGSSNITFTGDPSDFFVLNISGKLALTGSSIIGAGDIDPSHILINLYDNSGNLGTAAHVGNVLNGTVLVPFDTVTFHSMNGAIWAGDGEITLMSGATLHSIPFVPEPTTISLIIVGGLVTARSLVRRRRRLA